MVSIPWRSDSLLAVWDSAYTESNIFRIDVSEDLDDDAGGLNALNEPNETRLWIYEPQAESWSHVSWELAPKPENAAWVGLSEITEVPGTDDYIVIERDNRTGDFAVLKTLVKFDWSDATGDGIVADGEKRTYDLLPNLNATNGWITDKTGGGGRDLERRHLCGHRQRRR
jgi:hypothetical protein